ncbi:hypothetical protein BH24ACT22_BH24ACT22_03930 [soil metagenome]
MFGSKSNAAKEVLKSKTGRKAVAKGAKGAFRVGRSDTAQGTGRMGAKGLGRLARGAAKAKAGKEAGKVGAKGLGKAGRGAGKYAARRGQKEVKIAEKNLSSGSSSGSRLLKFGLLTIAGLAIGALVGRLMSSGDDSGQDGSSTGSDSSPGSSTTTADRPSAGENVDTDSQRAHSDPSSGPLIGTSHEGDKEGVTEDQPELDQRIRTRIGEDERTRDMPRVNVEVNDGIAELRGEAPSDEAKDAAGEIAAEVEGVKEVRNLIETKS